MNNIADHNLANDLKWSRRSKNYDDKRFDYFRYMQKKLISIMDLKENSNFLDIGCGTGWAVCHVSRILKGKGNFIGIDISEGMIEKAGENSKNLSNVIFYKASSEEIPLESGYFDNIICTNSFHHYLNPASVMQEIYRVLKPGGKLHILDVTADDFIVRWVDGRVGKKEKEHVRFYSTKEYRIMFKEASLKYVKSRIIGTYPLKVHIAEK
jgi:ubiquinone/menaquinone biosynthesis C-methylase UbiE